MEEEGGKERNAAVHQLHKKCKMAENSRTVIIKLSGFQKNQRQRQKSDPSDVSGCKVNAGTKQAVLFPCCTAPTRRTQSCTELMGSGRTGLCVFPALCHQGTGEGQSLGQVGHWAHREYAK